MIKNKDLRYLNVAKEVSKCSDFKRTNIGCCIVYKNDILAVGYNSEKTHTLQKKYNHYRGLNDQKNVEDKEHSEISAISKLPYYVIENDFKLNKATIYVYRENKSTHELANAKPCPACMAAIIGSNIGRIVHTIDYGIAEIKLNNNNNDNNKLIIHKRSIKNDKKILQQVW